MLKKRLFMFLCLIFAVPLLISGVFAKPNDETEVRKTVAGFYQSWNAHDMDAFGKLFTTDADFVNVVGDWWKGRQDIQLHHAFSHGTIPADTKGFEGMQPLYGMFKSSVVQFTQTDVKFLQSGVAVAHVLWELRGDTHTSEFRQGIITFVLVRQGNSWLVAAAQNTDILRPAK